MIIEIISYISVLALLISLLNLVLSLIVYYGVNDYINELADQYMEKAIPSYSRVYLPSLKKMDQLV